MKLETIAIHGGHSSDPTTKAIAVPIYETVAYEFDSADHAADLFNLETEGYRYSRISNPTTAALERRLTLLEGGVESMVVSTGQAALNYAILNLVSPGRNIVSTPQLYGTTHTLFAHFLPALGIQVRFAESARPSDVARLIDQDTRAVFCETIGNPGGSIADLEGLASLAHGHGIPLVADNTIATPVLLRPIEHGADIVVHSLTKFLGGHGSVLGGAIIDSGRFDWQASAERFPMFTTADPSYHGLIYTQRFGKAAYIARCRSVFLRVNGAALSPLSAFLLLQGVETVAVRVERHVQNAREVAGFLRNHPKVAWVNYAGFEDNAEYASMRKYMGGRASSVFTFGLVGGLQAAKNFYDSLKLIKRVVNLGDVRSLACHPASTTHRQMTEQQQCSAGVYPEMVRVSIGIEQVDDIIADMDQAFSAATLHHDVTRDLAFK